MVGRIAFVGLEAEGPPINIFHSFRWMRDMNNKVGAFEASSFVYLLANYFNFEASHQHQVLLLEIYPTS